MIVLSRDSPLRLVWMSFPKNGEEPQIALVFLSLLIGILVSGYLCFNVGSVLAFEATRAIVRVVGGYRSEWIRFLNKEVHKGFRRCRKASSTTTSARALRHPLTGSIEGYRVEYAYQLPVQGGTVSEFKRVILTENSVVGDEIDDNAGVSVSYYRKEIVRSLAECIQRENHFKFKRRRSKDDSDTDDSSSSSDSDSDSESSSCSGEEELGDNQNSNLRKRHRKPLLKHNPEPVEEDSFLLPVSSRHKPSFECGVPYGYWVQKRRELLLWSELVEPGIAFFGITFYLVLCFLQALLTDMFEYPVQLHDLVWIITLRSVVAIPLMIPYCILEARAIQRNRMLSWKNGGDFLEASATEFERIRNAFRWCMCFGKDGFDSDGTATREAVTKHSWRYYARREVLYAPSFVCGTLLLWLTCGPMTLACGYAMIYCMLQWAQETAPTRKQILEAFRKNPQVLSKIPATATLTKRGRGERYVRLEYTVPVPGVTIVKDPTDEDTAIVVAKDITSAKVYELCESDPSLTHRVSIHLHPSYPLSGYPTIQLDQDISDSWNLPKWQFLYFVCLGVYVVALGYGLRLSFYDTFGYYDEDLVVAGILMISGPALLLPGASVLRQIQHDRFLLDVLYEPKVSVRTSAQEQPRLARITIRSNSI